MNYELIAIAAFLLAIAYGVSVLFVMGITFGAASLMGKRLAAEGKTSWTWNAINIATWIIASAIAGAIVQVPTGINQFNMTASMAAILLAVHLRSTFAMKRQQSPAMELLLCVLCPMAAFVPYMFL